MRCVGRGDGALWTPGAVSRPPHPCHLTPRSLLCPSPLTTAASAPESSPPPPAPLAARMPARSWLPPPPGVAPLPSFQVLVPRHLHGDPAGSAWGHFSSQPHSGWSHPGSDNPHACVSRQDLPLSQSHRASGFRDTCSLSLSFYSDAVTSGAWRDWPSRDHPIPRDSK